MNYYKNVFKVYQCCSYSRYVLSKNYSCVIANACNVLTLPKKHNISHLTCSSNSKQLCTTYAADEGIDQELTTDLYPYLENYSETQQDTAWNSLFPRETDSKSLYINKCASVKEVLSFAQDNLNNLEDKHLTQIIVAISDLQTLFFYHMDDESARKNGFFKKLLEHKEFYSVLEKIKNTKTYHPKYLSYTLLHLFKLGLPVNDSLIQDSVIHLRNFLIEDFSLEIAANLWKIVFSEYSVRPYYTIINLIPLLIEQIDVVGNVKDLEYLTLCLNRMAPILTEETIDKCKAKVLELIDSKILQGSDYHSLLKIILLFSFPKWRNKECEFISKCVLLMEDHINMLNFTQLELLHEVLFKIQEPGDALNTIQRCAAKYLQQLEDTNTHTNSRLKLFSSLIYFSSPTNTVQFRQSLDKYINNQIDLEGLLTLRKIYNYLKVTDIDLCESYWNRACRLLKTHKDLTNLVRQMENYIQFTSYHTNYRHYAFEHHVMKLTEQYYKDGSLTIIPSNFFVCFNFAILFCQDYWFICKLLMHFQDLYKQLATSSVLKLSQTLHMLQFIRNPAVTKQNKEDVKKLLKEATEKIFTYKSRPTVNSALVRAAVFRGDYDNQLINDIILANRHVPYISSKIIEGLCFNLYATDTLIPETINSCTEYVIKNKGRIMGFNVEKLLYLCYYLNYYPVHAEEFFQTVVDIILRDQERTSGLTFLQAAMALSYFNRIPKSFVKQIFNVEFLDRLDLELSNCYFKERYPHRVRYILMQLNRSMCLEYPEYNIPWFHTKYIDEYQKNYAIDNVLNKCQMRVREYLYEVVPKQYTLENTRVPYGYRINFVIHLDQDSKPTVHFDDPNTVKVAVLIKFPRSYTKQCIHLKGQDTLKNRHLEILGYKVKIIMWDEFVNLLYGSERLEFINKTVLS